MEEFVRVKGLVNVLTVCPHLASMLARTPGEAWSSLKSFRDVPVSEGNTSPWEIRSQWRSHFVSKAETTPLRVHAVCWKAGVSWRFTRAHGMQHLCRRPGWTDSLWSVECVQVSHAADKTRVCPSPPPRPHPHHHYNHIPQLTWPAAATRLTTWPRNVSADGAISKRFL